MKKKLILTLKVFKKKKINLIIKKKILKLKNQHFKHSIKKHNEWFKKNIKKNDYHNLLFSNQKLIGYNCLRKLKFSIFKKKKEIKKNILLFDTLIVDKKYRGLGFSEKIMFSSNKIISENNLPGLLFCEKKLIKFYNQFNWKLLRKSQIKSKRSLRLNAMIFNFNINKLKNKILHIEFT